MEVDAVVKAWRQVNGVTHDGDFAYFFSTMGEAQAEAGDCREGSGGQPSGGNPAGGGWMPPSNHFGNHEGIFFEAVSLDASSRATAQWQVALQSQKVAWKEEHWSVEHVPGEVLSQPAAGHHQASQSRPKIWVGEDPEDDEAAVEDVWAYLDNMFIYMVALAMAGVTAIYVNV